MVTANGKPHHVGVGAGHGMSAQISPNIVLGYRAQGTQQPGMAVLLSYDELMATVRKIVAGFECPWGAATSRQVDVRATHTRALKNDPATAAPWLAGQGRNASTASPWVLSRFNDTDRRAPWQHYASRPLVQHRVPWVLSRNQDAERSGPWGEYLRQLALEPVMPWGLSRKQDTEGTGLWGQYAAHLSRSAGAAWAKASSADREQWHPWSRYSRTVQPAWSVTLPDGSVVDIFYILPARFYMTAHTIFAERLPDLADVPIFEATVSADAGSYCWSLSASGPASLFAQLAPVDGLPVQLRLWLDGLPWVFAIDAISRSGSFGKTGVSISGRSVTALIGAPYLRATTRGNAGGALTAQQLALDALQYSGVDLDWGVASGALANGGLADWLVPAGAWSHQGTPLDAVQAIAQAAGGYLQSDRFAPMLLARHPYGQRAGDNPGAPWGWMTGAADVELAPDAIITEGLERKDGPDLNAVYVSGTTQGVLAQVKRAGSAGDKLAQMVTDPLITHVDAARQRGLAILGAAGSKYHVRLDLPVLTGAGQPGVLDVGQLVQVNASTPWRGRVRAVSVNAKRPSLRQSVTLERHLETV